MTPFAAGAATAAALGSFAGTVAIGTLVIVALWVAFWGTAGAMLASQRGDRAWHGFFWGAFFGPIGLLIVWLLTRHARSERRSGRSELPHSIESSDEPPWAN